ncbi:MAG: 50S ribosomal protein L10 [Candidatus Micrarchaeia archaeon]
MMLKSEKIKFVNELGNEISNYKGVAIMPLNGVPDRLLQSIRNQLKPGAKIVVARKNLLLKAFEKSGKAEKLKNYVDGDVALLLTNDDPFSVYKKITGKVLKLGAKPSQIAPQDIFIDAGETTIAPGPAVTDLKAAGLDVQIQKGKVIIAKGKKLVQKGTKISTAVAKALKMLEITPFEARAGVSAFLYDNLMFTSDILSIDSEKTAGDIVAGFAAAYALTVDIEYVTKYNVNVFISKAYAEAVKLGLDAEIYDTGITDLLLARASAQAGALNGKVNVNA